jgi:uncharacterized protein YjbJ (UPF0337 family)
MNQDHIEGAWEQLKGKSRKLWAELTDDDFQKAQGSAEKLYGTIQSKFGDTKEKILEKISQLKM